VSHQHPTKEKATVKKIAGLSVLCSTALLLAACGGGVSTPEPALPPGAVDAGAAAPGPLALSTTVGNVRVSGTDADVGFPPGCQGDACEITVTPGVLVVVWLEGENGGPIIGDLTEDCEENASLIGEDNQPNSCFSAGVLDGRNYVIFPVAVPSSRYALCWGDNPPLEIVP
jgi:hypothetical protein